MQRVSALLPSRERAKSTDGKPAGTLSKVFSWGGRIASPRAIVTSTTSPLGSKVGREVYWPAALDRECEKAARILKSFCTDGFLAPDGQEDSSVSASPTTATAPPATKPVLKKIPPRIIQDAVGLAIFSCMRSGLWMSGSGGSGILIARKADGTWSPPSGILLHTASLGFALGVDIYDCVLVVNSIAALEMLTRPKMVLGTDVNLAVGPLAEAGLFENDVRWKDLGGTVLTYLKARGQHRPVPIDGSLVTERGNENERFYAAASVDVLDILAGNVRKSIPEIQPLFEVIKAAEGRTDFDSATMERLALQPAPGDAVIETPTITPVSPRPSFGIPNVEDPDPFGVLALEMAGLEIREAGTKMRPASSQFEFNPTPTSPVFNRFNRQSADTYMSMSNRGSYMSTKTQATAMTDACTQTGTPDTAMSPNHSDDGKDYTISESVAAVAREDDEVDYTKVDMSAIKHLSQESLEATAAATQTEAAQAQAPPQHQQEEQQKKQVDQGVMTCDADDEVKASSLYPEDELDGDADDEDEDDEDEEPIIYEVATTQPTRAAIMSSHVTPIVQAKGSLVTIPKRVVPGSKSDYGDVSMLRSPVRQSFESAHTHASISEMAEAEAMLATPTASSITTTTEPVEEAAEKPVVVDVGAGQPVGHHRHSSSVYTMVGKRLSTASASEIPPTPQATEHATSADESDRGPLTPRVEDDISPKGDDGERKDAEHVMKIEANHLDSTAIVVA